MITIYKEKKLPKELVQLNDVYFNKYTVNMLDDRARSIVSRVDDSELIDNYTMKGKFDDTIMNTDKLSTGCKTVLNVMYNPDKIFDIRECGENALDLIYALEDGQVYCEYPVISFDMKTVKAVDRNGEHVITDYDELKEWWQHDN